MDHQVATHHLNAFQMQISENGSVSSNSNMSGTFVKLNNSLKVNQRKQKKSSQTHSEREYLMSENESLQSFKQIEKQEMDSQLQLNLNSAIKTKIPPPPMLVQAMSSYVKQQTFKNMPTAVVKIQDKAKSVTIVDNVNNGSAQGKTKAKIIIMSPPHYKEEIDGVKESTIKEVSHDYSMTNSLIKKENQDQSAISQDQVPQEDEDQPFIVKINIKNHSNIPNNVKIPNPNYNILEQAKFILMNEFNNQVEEGFQLSEDLLSRTIKQIHNHLIKQKEAEHERTILDFNKQIVSLQTQINLLTNSQSKQSQVNPFSKKATKTGQETPGSFGRTQSQNLNESTQQQDLQLTQETKKLRDDNQEYRMKAQFLEQDLQFQAQKTKDLQVKYECEIENLRSQLKGSQSEQFVKQQVEHKRLMEDNSVLMREFKILQDQLREEQQRVIDLFEDAQVVKDEILKEMTEFERTKGELDKMKAINKNLRKKLNDNSLEISEFDQIGSDSGDNDGYSMQDDTLGGETNMGRKIKKKQVQQVSIGISRPESLLSLANGFNQRLEELIDEKSKSIVNVLTQSQATQNQNYQHPYALNYQGQQTNYYQQTPYQNQNEDGQTHQFKPHRLSRKIVEMSLYESENGGYNQESSSNFENHHSQNESSQRYNRILMSNASDLQILKHKIKEVRDKHNSQLQDSQQDPNVFSQTSLGNQNKLNKDNSYSQVPDQKILQTQSSNAKTFRAINSGIIKQEVQQPIDFYLRQIQSLNFEGEDDINSKINNHLVKNHDDNDDQQLKNLFKTPVWTSQFLKGGDTTDEERKEDEQTNIQKRVSMKTTQQNLHQSFNQVNEQNGNCKEQENTFSP